VLDPAHYKLIADFEARFPPGAPSLREAERLTVEGDVTFGAGVVVRGEATVSGPEPVPDGAALGG
jgi:UTP--glucose-1-phosphate uridylyltransferase